MNFSLSNQFSLVIVLITISSVLPMVNLPIGNTFFWWIVYTFSIIVFIKRIYFSGIFSKSESNSLLFVKLLVGWYLICIIRGCFTADNYWEWKNLVQTSFTMLIPLISFLAINPLFVSFITNKWIKWALPLFFLVLFFLTGDGTGRYLVPISFLLLFFPLVPKKWKIILIFFSLFIFFGNLDARSNLLKFAVPLIMSCGIYFGVYKSKWVIQPLFGILLLLPIVLFSLAVSGIFNVFKMDEYIGNGESKIVTQNGEEVNMTADTRTFIYYEVLESAIRHQYYLFGRTPARGNDSEAFGWAIKEQLGLTNNERFANEVSILNVFTWTGLIGVLLYFLSFAWASYLAVFKSHNQYAKLFGLYILFRWCYAWVEDFTNFDLSYLYLWMTIGLAYSAKFRAMTERQVKIFVFSFFNLKYNKILKYTFRTQGKKY